MLYSYTHLHGLFILRLSIGDMMIPYIQTAIDSLEHVKRELTVNANRHDIHKNPNPTFIGASKKKQEVEKAIKFMKLLDQK